MNQGVHSVDFIQWAVSPVKRIMARTGTFAHNIECEDVGMALVEFENGAIGNIVCTTAAYPGYSNDFHVFGEHGSIIVRNDSEVVSWRIKGPNEQAEDEEMRRTYPGGRGNPSSNPMAVGFDGHTQEIEDMVNPIRDNREPVIPGEQARHAIEIILAIQKSAETGQWVTLPDPGTEQPDADLAETPAALGPPAPPMTEGPVPIPAYGKAAGLSPEGRPEAAASMRQTNMGWVRVPCWPCQCTFSCSGWW